MTDVCREFGISRKTGYKIFDRYKEHGLEALTDRSRRPVRYANQLAPQIEHLIVACKREKPHWGARKVRELLVRRLDQDFPIPAKSTIQEHDPRSPAPARPSQTARPAAPSRKRNASFGGSIPKWALVRRFQRRVQAGRRALLLSPHRHRLCLTLPSAV